VDPRAQLLRKDRVDGSVALDQRHAREPLRDDVDLEVCLRVTWHVVHVTLVDDVQEGREEVGLQFGGDTPRNSHFPAKNSDNYRNIAMFEKSDSTFNTFKL